MTNNTFQLNYDEMTSIAKNFKDEGEDTLRLHATTRQRVRDLHKEWVGEAADKFFEEMETELLPALQRLSRALFHTQDVSNNIMKVIQGADEETTNYFKDGLSGGDDFGAGKFNSALDGLQGGQQGGDLPGGSSAPEDFGASTFGETIGGGGSTDPNPNNPNNSQNNSSQGGGGGQNNSNQQDKQPQETQSTEKPTSGGGGSGSSSQGLKGDLKNMGAGIGNVAQQNAESGGGGVGGPANMPDHVYSNDGTSTTPNVGGSQQSSSGGGSSSNSGQPSGGGGAAAGAAGAAAAGGAAKAIRGRKKKDSGE